MTVPFIPKAPRLMLLLFTVCFFVTSLLAQAQTVRYVKQGGIGDGSSWTNAAGDLQAMINASASGDEIWVAEGTYLPTRPANNLGTVALNDRRNAFTFTRDLKIYGGFPSVNNPGMADRDWQAYPSVLSGNLGDPDAQTDNAYHVVITAGASVTNGFLMDGFTITGGYGDVVEMMTVNGRYIDQRAGAGWHNVAGHPTASHLLITGNAVTNAGGGAGLYNNVNGNMTLSYSIIRGNQAADTGGGLHSGNGSSVTLTNVIISENTASGGGGMSIDGNSATLVNVTISGNTADFGGGVSSRDASLALTNVLISGNKAKNNGGGLYNNDASSILTNCTISGNSAPQGSAMFCSGFMLPDPTIIRNSIIWANDGPLFNPSLVPAVSYSLVEDAVGDPTNLIGVDPLFVDAQDDNEAPFTLGDYRLQAGSLAIDAGNNAIYSGDLATDTDLTGNPRLAGSAVDIGASEFHEAAITPGAGNILYINRNVAGGTNSGDSWDNAIPDLVDALAWAKENAQDWTETNPLQIWVAAGEYQPHAGASFEMVDHVRIYGGFAGDEAERSERDWHQHTTSLVGNGNSVVRNPAALTLSRDAVLDGFTIRGGETGEGGGIYNHGNATFANLFITENTGSGSGGGMRNFGSPLLYNVLFTKNSSPLGAGFFNTEHDGRRSEPILINVTSSGNEGNTGQELHIEAGGPIIRNSIFYGNGVFSEMYRQYDIENSLVQTRTVNGDGNILGTTNPLFTDAANGDFSLRPASAAINAGSNQVYADYVGALAEQLDLHGAARAQQGTIDMGAFESTHVRVLIPAETGNVLYVDMDVDQRADDYTGDGSSWANAIPDLWNALTWVRENANSWTAANPLQIWVAQGEYQPGRGESFEMVDNVKIYGGFEGTETSLSARNLAGYTTTLYAHGNSVVRNPEGLTLSRNAVLDGFGISTFGYLGQEHASEGGGIYNSGDATFGNLYIMANTAEAAGGGVYNTGSPLFYNVIIAGNTAPKGAGFYNTSASSAPVLVNVTILGGLMNEGQAFYLEAGNPIIRNSIIYGNEVFGITDATDIQYSLVKGRMAADNGNIADVGFPLFEYASIELMMLPTSPTINTGSNQAYIDLVGPFDDQPGFFGFSRLQQGIIDMGAIETPFKKALNPDENNIVYINKTVDQTTTEYAADGSSWANAVPELADALLWARVKWQLDMFFPELSTGDPLKIYVAKGTYLPLYGLDDGSFMPVDGGRDNAFVMVPNTMLYGGFDPENGITALTHQRIAPSVGGESLTGGSILSGNLGDVNNQTDNAYHVVIAVNTTADESFLVDGFAITGGYADSDGSVWLNGQEVPRGTGGGWYNSIGSPIMGRAGISNNTAGVDRTGYTANWLHKLGGNPVLTKLVAEANRPKPINMTANRSRTYQVSALAAEGASPILTNVVISGNTAEDGGGMYNAMSSPTLTNVIISGNTATTGGGAMFNHLSYPTLTNVLINGNMALSGEGGGIHNEQSSVTLNNVTITSNTDGNGGGVISNVESTVTINNSIIYRNTGGISGDPVLSMTNSLVQGQAGGSDGNLDGTLDPRFNNADIGDFSLKATSPVIDKGSNDRYPGDLTTALDLAGNPRLSGIAIDMGAYESGVAAIAAFADIPAITVPFGTELSEISIPDLFAVEATLSNEGVIVIELERDPTQWTLTSSGVAYNGEVAGTYAFDITVPENPSAGYGNPLGLRANVEVIVEKGMPVISWADPALITYGTALGDDQLNASADVAGTFVYDPAAGTVMPAGEHTLNVTFTPDDDANYTTATAEVRLTVGKAQPVINWATPPAITYGTVLGDDQLNASAGVAGTFVYDPVAGTVLPAGDHTLNVTFTPEDGANYTTAAAEVVLTVNKALAIVTADALQTYTYDGAVKNAIASLNHDETMLTYSPQRGYMDAGTYRVTVAAAETANYQATSMELTLTITKADWTGTPVTFPNIDPIVYDGEEHEIVADNIPPGSEVDYTIIDGNGNEIPGNVITDAGDYTVIVVVRQDNYEDITVRTPVAINKAQAIITADAMQAHAYDGAFKNTLASLNHGETTLTYSPQRGYVDAGAYPIIITAAETANYRSASKEVTLSISKADWTGTPVTFPHIDPIVYDGEEHEIIADNIPPGSEVDYIIIDGNGNEIPGNVVTDAGDYTVIVVVRQDNYDDITVSTPVTIAKAQAVISGDVLQAHVYDGTVKNIAVNLNHSETALRYSPQQGYTNPGVYTLIVTADETANYLAAEAMTVTLRIEKAVWDGTDITLPQTPEFVYDGNPHSIVAENLPPDATVEYTVTDADGNTMPGNEVTEIGEYTVTVTVMQNNYRDVVVSSKVTVRPAVRTINFPALAAKTYGDADFSGGATTSSGEAVSYTSSNTAVAAITADGLIRIVGAGETTITATLPENGNYSNRPQISRTLVVGKAQQSIAFNAPAEVNRDAGNIQLDVTASSGLPLNLTIDDEQVATFDGTTLNIHTLGTINITAVQEGDGNYEAAEPVTVTIRVVDPSADFAVRIHPAVSPNGDGINEFLMIEGIRDYPENRVTVITKNGTVVYEAEGYDNSNVVFRGKGTGQLLLPAGTYFYIVEVKENGRWTHKKGYFVMRY